MVTWQNTSRNSTKVFAPHVAQFSFFSIHLNQIIVFWHHHCLWHDYCFSSLSSCTVPGCSLKGIAFVALLQYYCWFLITSLLSNSVLSWPGYHYTTVGCAVHSTWSKRDVIFKLSTFFSINCEMTIISENWYCFRCSVNQILQQICWLCCLPQG